MQFDMPRGLIERPELHDAKGVFRDRGHAGEVLAGLLEPYRIHYVLAIPAGGAPVAVAVARKLGLPLDAAVVSKLRLPWNVEAGYGAVAFDGTVSLNEALIPDLGLTQVEIDRGIRSTRKCVERCVSRMRRGRPWPDLARRRVLLVNDGLASGFTMRVAVLALRRMQVEQLAVAVPTAHARAAEHLLRHVDAIVCPNVREGRRFAVADAYACWTHFGEDEGIDALLEYQAQSGHAARS